MTIVSLKFSTYYPTLAPDKLTCNSNVSIVYTYQANWKCFTFHYIPTYLISNLSFWLRLTEKANMELDFSVVVIIYNQYFDINDWDWMKKIIYNYHFVWCRCTYQSNWTCFFYYLSNWSGLYKLINWNLFKVIRHF